MSFSYLKKIPGANYVRRDVEGGGRILVDLRGPQRFGSYWLRI
jgi:hypothetical protein